MNHFHIFYRRDIFNTFNKQINIAKVYIFSNVLNRIINNNKLAFVYRIKKFNFIEVLAIKIEVIII